MSAPPGIHFPTASLGTSFPTVSGVKLVRDTVTHDVNIHSFLGGVKEGRWREPVQQIRQAFAAGGKKAANPLKEKLPAITISGRFRERNDAAIEMHSGLLCVDLDNLNGDLDAIRKKLELDRYVFAFFTSPTGAGLKVIVPIEADAVKHDESFKDAQHYFKDTYDIDVDQSCRNPSRLCYVSYDPEMFSRPNAEIIPQRPPNAYKELTRRFGAPYISNGKGNIQINQMFFVGRFGIEHLVLHEPNERDFYTYDAQSGAWVPRTTDSIKAMFSEDWQRYAHQVDEPALLTLRTNSLLENFTSLLRGHVEKPEAFKRNGRVIHLQNGMLHLDHEGAQLRPFSADYLSRNVCPIAWEPDADCPRFKSELLSSALDPDDISLLQRWCGSLLLGGNAAQRIMILTGTPGGGKSTLLEIIEAVIGPANVCQLRTEHLSNRFELSRFLRKTTLSGKDVKGNFLQTEGAHVLKALVGHDLLSAERKGSNIEFQIKGEFGVAVSCNSRLRVKLDGDVDAWRRRLLIIRYEKPKPKERILDFAEKLLTEEASGILQWMVDGAIMHLRECDAMGEYHLTGAQEDRVDQFLAESDSIRHFVTDRIEEAPDCDLTTTEIVSAYFDYCSESGWVAFSSREVELALPDMMLELFHSARSTHIQRPSGRTKGYPHVALAAK
jgi:P4 family phage/plasmid primase-like protien